MAGRPPVRSATLGPFAGTLKLSGTLSTDLLKYRKTDDTPQKYIGIIIKSDPKGSYRPSRTIELIVDGEPRTVSFQLRETPTTLSWEVKPAV